MKVSQTQTSDGQIITIFLEKSFKLNLLPTITQLVAGQYVTENYAEIIAQLNVKAIANQLIVTIARETHKQLVNEDKDYNNDRNKA